MKRVTTIIVPTLIMVIMIFSTCFIITFGNPLNEFKDVPNTAWYKEHLNYILNDSREILDGYPDGTFKPDDTLTVEQFVKCVVVAGGFEVGEPKAGEEWSKPYIDNAIELGYVLIHEFNTYNQPITRGEMTRIIVRAVKDITGEYEYRDKSYFIRKIKDYYSIDEGLQDYVRKAYDMGILKGYPDGTFKADKSLTRGEGVKVIHMLIDVSVREIEEIESSGVVEGVKINDFDDPDKLDFNITIDVRYPLEPQYVEVEKFLNNKIGEELTKEIIAYARQKKEFSNPLPEDCIKWDGAIEEYFAMSEEERKELTWNGTYEDYWLELSKEERDQLNVKGKFWRWDNTYIQVISGLKNSIITICAW